MTYYYNEEIADHVYALILGITRQIPRFTRNQDKRYWEPARVIRLWIRKGSRRPPKGL